MGDRELREPPRPAPCPPQQRQGLGAGTGLPGVPGETRLPVARRLGDTASLSAVRVALAAPATHTPALPLCDTDSTLSAPSPLANCPPRHPGPHPLGIGCQASVPQGAPGAKMGPVGGRQPRASVPAPDASPAVAFPLSATSSPSRLAAGPSPSILRPPHAPSVRRPRPAAGHPLTASHAATPPRGAGGAGPGNRARGTSREVRGAGQRHFAASPSLPSQLALAGLLQIESFLGSCPLCDFSPFHHLRERLKPGTNKNCRIL